MRYLFSTFIALAPWALIAHEQWTALVLVNLFIAIAAAVVCDDDPKSKTSQAIGCAVLITFILQLIYAIAA